jgi:serine/threonine-protein kinase
MDSARWDRVQTLFHDAADLPASEQRGFLMAACAGDDGMVADVLRLIEGDGRGAPLLERGVAHAANDVFGETAIAPANREIGRYRLKRLLGEGGMGVVYLAEREDLGSVVSIKILRDAWMSPSRRERFTAEQRMLAQLTHPNIARIYDADTLPDGTPWFAMEYVEGLPLTAYCSTHQCTIAERLRLFRSVCEAVEYAHGHAIIHRDLKPSNILVKEDGSVRLLDFGIAKHLDGTGQPVDRTVTGLRLMTPAYAAPEQIRGEQVGVQTDVYGLGVILYELLAGRPPFDLSNLTPAEAAAAITGGEPERPSQCRSLARSGGAGRLSLPRAAWADLDVLCLTAMHKDQRRRYRSVEALMRDLDHFLNEEPLESRPDSISYRLRKFIARHRRAVFATASVFALLLTLVVFFTVRLARARNAALAEAARTARIQQFMLNLFEGGDKAAGPADDLRVVTLIDRGAAEARALANEPAVQAELYQTLGGIYQKLGKFDRADSLLRAALDQRRAVLGAGHPQVAETLLALGLLRLDQAQLDEAERLARDGLEKIQRMRPPDDGALARATAGVGKVLAARGRYKEAIALLEEAVKLQERLSPSSADLAASLTELAYAQFTNGNYDAAEPLDRRALAMHRQLNGERHPLVAADLISLGDIQFQRGRYDAAEQLDRQGLEIARAFYGENHYQTSAAMISLSQALIFEKKFDEADAILRQALAIRERAYGPVHPSVADTLNEIGNLAYQRDQLEEAEACFRRMFDIHRAVYGDHHYLPAIALSNLASVYMDRKDWRRAEQMYRDVNRRFGETLPADHMNRAIAEVKLGRTLVRQHRYIEAEPHTLAGLQILLKQTSPSVSWLRGARKDLVEIYTAAGQPRKAAEFQAQLDAAVVGQVGNLRRIGNPPPPPAAPLP